jgi:amphi-Trp domain-containing protein
MMSKEKVKSEGVIEASQAVHYLREILESMEKGSLEVQTEDRSLALCFPKYVEFEVKAKQKDGRSGLSIDLFWKEGLEPSADLGLRIGSSSRSQSTGEFAEHGATRFESTERECLRTAAPAQEPAPCTEI